MTREIISARQVITGNVPNNTHVPNNYRDRLVKLIPSEIVAAYLTIYGLVQGSGGNTNYDMILWIVIGILFIFTPVYLVKFMEVKKPLQILFTSFGFIIWVMVSGWPQDEILGVSAAFFGSILLVLYTLLIPLVYKG
jgi:hypothetical protein